MKRIKKDSWRKRKRLWAAGISSILLVLLFCIAIGTGSRTEAAQQGVWLSIGGASQSGGVITPEYSMDQSSILVYLETDGEIKIEDTKYEIRWSFGNGKEDPVTHKFGETNEIASVYPADSKHIAMVTAIGTGEVTLQAVILDRDSGAQIKTATCKIKVDFGLKTGSDPDFQSINEGEKKSLILDCSQEPLGTGDQKVEKTLELIFNAPSAVWESDNTDVVAFYDGTKLESKITGDSRTGSVKIRTVGAGKATLTVRFTDAQGKEQTPATLNVYVRPLITSSVAVDAGGNFIWKNKGIDYQMDSGGFVYARVSFDDVTLSLSQKLTWAVLYDKEGNGEKKFLKDSLGNKGRDFTETDYDAFNLDIFDTNGGAYKVNAKAGTYQILFYVAGTYKTEYNNDFSAAPCKPVIVDLTVYANIRDTKQSIVVEDIFDTADFFNLPYEFVQKHFNIGYAPDSEGREETVRYDAKGILTAINIGSSIVTFEVKNDSKAIINKLMKVKIPDSGVWTFRINLNVIEAFKLDKTSFTTYAGTEVNLQSSLYPYLSGAVYEWETSDSRYATVENKGYEATVKAVTKTPPGEPVVITVTCTLPSGVKRKATCKITIKDSIQNIKLDPTECTMMENDVKIIKTVGINGDVPFIWMSSDDSVVSVEPLAGNATATMTAKKPGTAIITVMNEQNFVRATCSVKVTGEVKGLKFAQGTEMTVRLQQSVIQMQPVFTPSDLQNIVLQWGSSDTKVATVDDNGLVKLIGPGTTTITAVPKGYPLMTAYCRITVLQTSTGFRFNQSAVTVEAKKKVKLSYTLTPSDANTTITWKSLNTSIATVDSTGEVTGVAGGQTYIVATTSEGYTDICHITVTQAASNIVLSTYNVTLGVGDSYQVVAVSSPTSATETTFTWTSRDPKIATVTNDGRITGVSAGSTIILVKTKSGKVEYVYVTVRDTLMGMTLNYNTKTVTKGKTFTLKPVFVPANATNQKVNYKSSNTAVATVTSKGVVKGVKGGTAIITAVAEDGGYTAYCIVTVQERVTSIKLDKTSAKVGVGRSLTLKATLASNYASKQTLKWTSSNIKVATVDKNGKVTGKALGKCVIKCTSTDGSGISASCTITVIRSATSITLDKSTLKMVEGRTASLRATIKPGNTTYKTVTWSSSDENIAMVDSKGTILALSAGKCKITAAAKDDSKKSASCWVFVSTAVPSTGVIVSQKDMFMVKGTSEALSVSIQPSNTTDGLKFSSDTKNVASVSSKGLVTARKPGVATITVTTSSGKQTTVNVTVVGLNKTSITMRQYDIEYLWLEETSAGVKWQSMNPNIATVDQSGKVICRKPGTTTIVATIRGIKLSCKVTVLKL